MKRMIKRIGALLLAAVLLVQPVTVSAAENINIQDQIDASLSAALSWCRGENEQIFTEEFNESLGNSSVADWVAITIGRLGVADNYEGALAALEQYVTNAYQTEGLLHRTKSTEWHRISLAVLALGGDPTSFGTDPEGNPINLIADGVYNRGEINSLGAQGVNGWIWGLIALDSMRYEIPEGSYYTREDILAEILSRQEKNGVISLMPGSEDVDITAMALQALAPYYADVTEAVDKALAWLSENQQESGGYFYYGAENAESTAQVIVALCSLGIDPTTDERFIKNGNTLIDALLSFQMESGGFCHIMDGTGEDLMATEQSMYALCAVRRFLNGQRTLYDFREENESAEPIESIENAAGAEAVSEEKVQKNLEDPMVFLLVIIIAAIGVVLFGAVIVAALLHKGKKHKKREKRNEKTKEEMQDDSW